MCTEYVLMSLTAFPLLLRIKKNGILQLLGGQKDSGYPQGKSVPSIGLDLSCQEKRCPGNSGSDFSDSFPWERRERDKAGWNGRGTGSSQDGELAEESLHDEDTGCEDVRL